MTGQVDDKIKKSRSNRMLALARNSGDKYRRKYLGKTMNILFENEVIPGSGIYSGLSENYIRVYADSTAPISGFFLPVKLTRLHQHDIRGEIVG